MRSNSLRISILGTGYVGLVTGAGLAAKGFTVLCLDKRKDIVAQINARKTPIYEKGLDGLLQRYVGKNLEATSNLEDAIIRTDISFICVGTPSSPGGKISLEHLEEVVRSIGRALRKKKGFHVVVVKSTVVPGTTLRIVGKLLELESGLKKTRDFGVAMNPEFLREGNAVEDFLRPDRIVIGSEDTRTRNMLEQIYRRFNAPQIHVSIPTAEMIKYATNSFFAMCISFSNEIANICERIDGVDGQEVLAALAMDRRIRSNIKMPPPAIMEYLKAGCGFGGSCFPKDVHALMYFAKERGYSPRLLRAILDINEERPGWVLKSIRRLLGNPHGKRVCILGTAFKPNTDDIRESPALKVIDGLLRAGAKVRVCDPVALENTRRRYGGKIQYFEKPREALQGADIAVLITQWEVFKRVKPSQFKQWMKRKNLVDGRRIYPKARYERYVKYAGVGQRA